MDACKWYPQFRYHQYCIHTYPRALFFFKSLHVKLKQVGKRRTDWVQIICVNEWKIMDSKGVSFQLWFFLRCFWLISGGYMPSQSRAIVWGWSKHIPGAKTWKIPKGTRSNRKSHTWNRMVCRKWQETSSGKCTTQNGKHTGGNRAGWWGLCDDTPGEK